MPPLNPAARTPDQMVMVPGDRPYLLIVPLDTGFVSVNGPLNNPRPGYHWRAPFVPRGAGGVWCGSAPGGGGPAAGPPPPSPCRAAGRHPKSDCGWADGCLKDTMLVKP